MPTIEWRRGCAVVVVVLCLFYLSPFTISWYNQTELKSELKTGAEQLSTGWSDRPTHFHPTPYDATTEMANGIHCTLHICHVPPWFDFYHLLFGFSHYVSCHPLTHQQDEKGESFFKYLSRNRCRLNSLQCSWCRMDSDFSFLGILSSSYSFLFLFFSFMFLYNSYIFYVTLFEYKV